LFIHIIIPTTPLPALLPYTTLFRSAGATPDDLAPILARLQLESMGSPDFYRRHLYRLGMRSVEFRDETPHLTQHYQRVLEETERRDRELEGKVSREYRERMKVGLRHWVDGGKAGNLAWGIFRASA